MNIDFFKVSTENALLISALLDGSFYEDPKGMPIDYFNPLKFGSNNSNSNNAGYNTKSIGLGKGVGPKFGGGYSHSETNVFGIGE